MLRFTLQAQTSAKQNRPRLASERWVGNGDVDVEEDTGRGSGVEGEGGGGQVKWEADEGDEVRGGGRGEGRGEGREETGTIKRGGGGEVRPSLPFPIEARDEEGDAADAHAGPTLALATALDVSLEMVEAEEEAVAPRLSLPSPREELPPTTKPTPTTIVPPLLLVCSSTPAEGVHFAAFARTLLAPTATIKGAAGAKDEEEEEEEEEAATVVGEDAARVVGEDRRVTTSP